MFGRKPKPQRSYGKMVLSFTAGALAGGTAVQGKVRKMANT